MSFMMGVGQIYQGVSQLQQADTQEKVSQDQADYAKAVGAVEAQQIERKGARAVGALNTGLAEAGISQHAGTGLALLIDQYYEITNAQNMAKSQAAYQSWYYRTSGKLQAAALRDRAVGSFISGTALMASSFGTFMDGKDGAGGSAIAAASGGGAGGGGI